MINMIVLYFVPLAIVQCCVYESGLDQEFSLNTYVNVLLFVFKIFQTSNTETFSHDFREFC